MRYITLTEEEPALLEDMKRKTTSKILLPRIECLLLSHQGMEVKALSAYLHVVTKTIYAWTDLWTEEGISGILPKGGSGSKKKLRGINSEQIHQMVRENARNLVSVLHELKEK
jgi:transposase